MLLNNYRIKINDITYKLEFRTNFTLIKGESGVGKTYLYTRRQNSAALAAGIHAAQITKFGKFFANI